MEKFIGVREDRKEGKAGMDRETAAAKLQKQLNSLVKPNTIGLTTPEADLENLQSYKRVSIKLSDTFVEDARNQLGGQILNLGYIFEHMKKWDE